MRRYAQLFRNRSEPVDVTAPPLEGLSKQDRARYTVFYNAVINCTRAYNEDPTAARLRDLRAAEEALEDLKTAIGLAEIHEAGDHRFKTRKEAYDWLRSQGCQVSIGKFYQDIKRRENNAPALNADKTLSRYQVELYRYKLGEQAAPPDLTAMAQDRVDYAHAREKAEAEIAQMKAERMRREEDNRWVEQITAWGVLAATLGELRDAIRRCLHDSQADLVSAAGGEPHRAPELYEAADQVIGRAFNQIAAKAVDITFVEDQDEA